MAAALPAAAQEAPTATPPPEAPQGVVEDVVIRGNEVVPVAEIMRLIRTRRTRPLDIEQVRRDVRRLAQNPRFLDAAPYYETLPSGGIRVIFDVHERPTLRYVAYYGNRRVKDKVLAEQTGMKPGDALDPYEVAEGRRRIEEYYTNNGYHKASVTIREGTRPTDKGAVYVIHEGPRPKIRATTFIGNSPGIATGARLKTQVKSKPGFLWVFRGTFDPQQLDTDDELLTDYYRGLGFFAAEVTPEVEFNDAQTWVTITFVINEGPRYTVQNVSFVGNSKFDNETIRAKLNVHAGDFFDRSAIQKDVATVREVYGGEGYIYADIAPEQIFYEEPGKLDLVYNIEEGFRCRVGQITPRIEGDAPHTRIDTILNRISLHPGDILDIREIEASERRLRASNLFNSNPQEGALPKLVLKPRDIGDYDGLFPNLPRRGGSPPAVAAPPSPPEGQRTSFLLPRRAGRPLERVVDVEVLGRLRGAIAADRSAPPAGIVEDRDGHESPMTTSGATLRGQSPDGRFFRRANPATVPPAANRLRNVRGQSPQQPSYGGMGTPSLAPSNPTVYYQPPPGTTIPPTAYPPGNYVPANAPRPVGPPNTAFPPATQAQVPGTGVDGSLQVYPDGGYPFLDPSEPERFVDIEPRVQEAPTGRFMVGVAVNSDAGLFGSIVLDEQNFDWTNFPRGMEDFRNGRAFRGRGQQLRIEAIPGTEVQRYMVNFREPYLWNSPISLGISGYSFDRRFDDWDEQRLGGRVSLGYQLAPDLWTTVALRAENVEVRNPRLPTPPELAEVIGDSELYVGRIQLTHDTRDNRFLATEGHLLELTYEQGLGSFDYPRGEVDARRYFLIRERADRSGRHVLTTRGRIGVSGSQTPVFEHFFAGGFSTIRGFDFRGASPVNMGTTVGGEFLLLGTVEYLFPITADDRLRGVVFCDFGTVEESVKIEGDDFRIAPGIGLRISLPRALGPAPIALDLAFPVAREDTDDIENLSFFIGFASP